MCFIDLSCLKHYSCSPSRLGSTPSAYLFLCGDNVSPFYLLRFSWLYVEIGECVTWDVDGLALKKQQGVWGEHLSQRVFLKYQ